MQQCVIERLATILGCLDEHLQVLHHLFLSAEIAESQWAQGILKVFFALREPFFAYVKIFVYHNSPAKIRKKPQITKNL